MNKIVLLSFTALTMYAGAEEIAMASNSSMTDSYSTPELNIVTLTSAAPNSSNGWYVFADALYWHADVGSTDWAFKNSDITQATRGGPNHSLNFKWGWGFRVGLGANMDYDEWDTNVYYTWFQTNNSNAIAAEANQAIADEFGLAELVTQGKIDWRIHYSMLDWELGRWFFVSNHLYLRPHVGVKGGWISQHVHEKFSSVHQSFRAKSENEFWGVGPCGGFNTTWDLGHINTHYFSLFGDFAGALMYGHFDVDHEEKETVIATGVEAFGFKPKHLDRNLAVPTLQAMLGFSWDTSFNRDRCHFTLRAGYELQYWFRQNQMLIGEFFTGKTGVGYTRAHDDLALQGLTFDFRFDF